MFFFIPFHICHISLNDLMSFLLSKHKINSILKGFEVTCTYQGPKCCLCEVKVAQSCLTLFNPMVYTVHGILQARILEWVAFPFSRASSQPRD